MHEVSPLRGSHHTPVHPTGVDTPACVVTAPMGLGAYASCGDMHTHYGAREPRRGDYSTVTGANPCTMWGRNRNPEGVTRVCNLRFDNLRFTKNVHIQASSANVYMFSPLRGSHHPSVHPTGVDTPACVVTAPMGLGTYASCGDMHTHYGAREPRRGNTIPMGVPHCPISGETSIGENSIHLSKISQKILSLHLSHVS